MKSLEQESFFQHTLYPHQPCITPDCIPHDTTRFATLRDQVKFYADVFDAHATAHQLKDEAQIIASDKFFPPSLQQHQPEEKA